MVIRPTDLLKHCHDHNHQIKKETLNLENKSINEALSDFLTKTVKLVRYQSQSFRDLGESATEAVKQTMFSDARPLLITNSEWPYTRAVLIRFPDEVEARRWYDSPEYQALAQHRWRASSGTVIGFDGF